jgi:glycosyltransferase involved in cell wall biosynthesis
MRSPRYSIIIPVFNRPQEIDELLSSLQGQTLHDFEVIVVEDGSTIRCDEIVDRYRDTLCIQYFFKPNSGPGPSRNFGFANAKGEYFIVFDSDCIIPQNYLMAVQESIHENHWDAWGGPDRPHENFTSVQRAIGYTMSSFLTTGGIRGGEKRMGWFQPRSFNMGISRKVFELTNGFMLSHFAEDIEFSIRIKEAGFNIGLIPEAYVYHKRRTNFKQFYTQVYNFGKGRAMIGKIHPRGIRLTHWFPSLFLMGILSLFLLPWISMVLFKIGASLLILYLLVILIHAFKENQNLLVALLSVPAALLQLVGYGAGFLMELVKRSP